MSEELDIAPSGLNLSQYFADFASSLRFEDLPPGVIGEARRGILDLIGCALAGSRHPGVDKVLAGLAKLGSSPHVPVIGRQCKLGLLEAATANGQIAHILDFDDTHSERVILHTSAPTLAALFSTIHTGVFNGREFITAYVLAFEAGMRIGKSAPAHQDSGFHLTGTLGALAAGVACGRLLRLNGRQMNHVLGLSATQAGGMKQNRGTMGKSFHAGRAASSGVLAAFLASEGVDSSLEIIEGRRGFARTFGGMAPDLDAISSGLGQDWHILRNGYKPYACGVVLHPLIDTAIMLRRSGVVPHSIERLELEVHPMVLRITSIENPRTGLEAKFSARHATAAAFLDQAAGFAQFTDARATAPDVEALRSRISIKSSETINLDEARGRIVEIDGRTHEIHVPHALGTTANPMTDAEIETKFSANASGVLSRDQAQTIVDTVQTLDRLDDVRELVALCR